MKRSNFRNFNWIQILNCFDLMGISLKLENEKSSNKALASQIGFPLGMVNATPFYSVEQLISLSKDLSASLTSLKDTQNQKLESLLNSVRVLFVYEDEELTDSFKPTLNLLMAKGVLFTYLDLSGKTSMKNMIKKRFPGSTLPCVILDNKTVISAGKSSISIYSSR